MSVSFSAAGLRDAFEIRVRTRHRRSRSRLRMSGDDQDLGAVDLELTVDSADDGRRFEVEDEVDPAIGAWPEPGPCECRTPAAVRLIIRMHCEHLPCRRDCRTVCRRTRYCWRIDADRQRCWNWMVLFITVKGYRRSICGTSDAL